MTGRGSRACVGEVRALDRVLVYLRPLIFRPALLGAITVLVGGVFALTVWSRWLFTVVIVLLATGLFLIKSVPNFKFSLIVLLVIISFTYISWLIIPGEVFTRQWANQQWQGRGVVVRYLGTWQAGDVEQCQAVVRVLQDSNRIDHTLSGPVYIAVAGAKGLLPQGSTLSISGFLKRPETAANPGGFDSRDWLWRQGIDLEMKVYERTVEILSPGRRSFIAPFIDATQSGLSRQAMQLVGSERAPLLLSILIGETKDLTAAQNYFFRQAGLSHLMAVSGANIAFWLLPVNSLLRRFHWRRKLRKGLLLMGLIGFGFLTGWQVSVTRAIVMMAILISGQLLHRRADPLNSLGWVVLIFTVISPRSLLGIGFWLSSLATVGLIAGAPALTSHLILRWPQLPEPIAVLLGLNLAVQALVLPITAALSHQISIVGLLANLPATLMVEWLTGFSLLALVLTAPLSSLGTISPILKTISDAMFAVFGKPLALGLDGLSELAEYFARLRWGRFNLSLVNVLAVVAISILVWAMLHPTHRLAHQTGKIAGAALACLLAINFALAIWAQPAAIWFFSVGQGDSTLIRTRQGTAILIDAGKPETGFNTILPALDALGIGRLEQLILTHGHLDHAGGAADLILSGRVENLVISKQEFTSGGDDNLSQKLIDLAKMNGVPVQAIANNDTILLDKTGLKLSVLASDYSDSSLADENENTLHFRLQMDAFSLLQMSDCTPAIESALLKAGHIAPSSILHVAHHGSKFTTLPEFLDTVKPQMAVISVGSNQYGHPAKELLERLSDRQIPYFRTDQAGALFINLKANPIRLIPFRKDIYGQTN